MVAQNMLPINLQELATYLAPLLFLFIPLPSESTYCRLSKNVLTLYPWYVFLEVKSMGVPGMGSILLLFSALEKSV